MLYSTTTALLCFAATARGAVHESLAALPSGWSRSSRAVPSASLIKLDVALQYRNLDQLESQLARVSTPGSAGYGDYMDLDTQNALFAPSSSDEARVVAWLRQAGASSVVSDGAIVSFVTTVGRANQMLDADFALYRNERDGDAVMKLRTMAYSVPDDLVDAVDLISPTTYLGSTTAQHRAPRRGRREEKKPAASRTLRAPPTRRQQLNPSCETTVDYAGEAFALLSPRCLKELYSIGNYTVDKSAGSSIAFGSFLNESASYSDLAEFERLFGIPQQEFKVLALINGGVDNQDPATESDGEANLDVQNMAGLVGGLPVGEYITGGSPPFVPDLLSPNASLNDNEPYLQYYAYLLAQPNAALPYVISNSYGDHEDTVPERYARRVCNMIGLMGLRGRTILESSGDEGVGAVCRANTGAMEAQFTPQFPGTCPYITAVGGTQFFNPEYAWNASSGGFSNYFPTAWYQRAAVDTYLADHISAGTKEYYSSNNYTNFAGRGFPDISAHSLYPYYLTVINGTAEPNGGTSAAAPVVASVVALLNDARLRAGQPALGFVNPLLYGTAAPAGTLNDITEGAALGCAGVDLQTGAVVPGAGIIPYASWNATPGW
ncbi:Tripeptidyl-peptidase sed4 [Xylariaceae sp. FL0804]|nr:Tripeptidyl-peptidase sed4 [Xylariaceae sp. FL0804]